MKDLVGWLSDSGRQIASIDIAGANSSNRYFGEILERVFEERKFIEVQGKDDKELLISIHLRGKEYFCALFNVKVNL